MRSHHSLLVRSYHSVEQNCWVLELCRFVHIQLLSVQKISRFLSLLVTDQTQRTVKITPPLSKVVAFSASGAVVYLNLSEAFSLSVVHLLCSCLRNLSCTAADGFWRVFALFLFWVQLWVMLGVVHAKYKLQGCRHRDSFQLLVRP